LRRRGIARALLAGALDLAHSAGDVRQVNVLANAENDAARRLYAAAGFEVFGHEPRSMRIDGAWHDEVHMRLDLEAG